MSPSAVLPDPSAVPADPSARPPEPESPRSWGRVLAPYARPRLARSVLDLATSVVPYLGLSVAIAFSLRVSVALALVLAVPAAGFLLRTYIVFHDCTHGSFLPTKRANVWLGTALGILVWTPFRNWRHSHAMHHASAGDLDRRGGGDVPTLTVAEYQSRSWRGRLAYRLFRNPLVMFGLGPIWAMVISPRLISRSQRSRMRRSTLATNAALAVMVGLLCWAIGWRTYLLVWGPAAWLAGSAGVWLFYVQHQFEDAYWEATDDWSFADAALRGSSYLRLPRLLQFFTANIGLHHVHHLSARIPNYNLQRAHDENPVFHAVPVMTITDGMRSTRLKLWDERSRRLVTFAEARRDSAAQPVERATTPPPAPATAASSA